MSNLIVGFSKPKQYKLFAKLIMIGYCIPYSHVYIKFWSDKFQRFLIYQASGTAVNFMGTTIFEDHNETIKEFELVLTDEDRIKMIQFALDNSGKSYGFKNALGLTVVRIMELFGKRIKNPLADDGKTYVCCELVGHVLKEYANTNIPYDLNTLNPKELYEFMLSIKA